MKVYLNKLCAAILCMAILFMPVKALGSNENDSETTTLTMDGYTRVVDVGHNVTLVAKTMDIDPNSGRCYIFEGWTVDGVEPDNIRHSYEGINHTSEVILFSVPSTGAEITTHRRIHGDVDTNGSVTALDLLKLLKDLKNGTVDKSNDINFDGNLTSIDKLELLKLIKGKFDYSKYTYSLYVEDKFVQYVDGSVPYNKELPLFAILEGLGAKIDSKDGNTIKLTFNNKYYTINKDFLPEIIYDERNADYPGGFWGQVMHTGITLVPGGIQTSTVRDDEIFISTTCLRVLINSWFHVDVAIVEDKTAKTISISFDE